MAAWYLEQTWHEIDVALDHLLAEIAITDSLAGGCLSVYWDTLTVRATRQEDGKWSFTFRVRVHA